MMYSFDTILDRKGRVLLDLKFQPDKWWKQPAVIIYGASVEEIIKLSVL